MAEARSSELGEVRDRVREAAGSLEAWAVEVLKLTKKIEDLTGGTPGWYAGMRTRVEAAETLCQARVLVRAMEHLDGSSDPASKDALKDG